MFHKSLNKFLVLMSVREKNFHRLRKRLVTMAADLCPGVAYLQTLSANAIKHWRHTSSLLFYDACSQLRDSLCFWPVYRSTLCVIVQAVNCSPFATSHEGQ